MKAMILAAGLGTRLLPLTADLPKALVRVNGMPLLEIAIRKLAAEGFDEIVVNTHHFSGQVADYLQKNEFPGVSIRVSDESALLLDTGGGILHARQYLEGNEPILVYNVDVVTDIGLGAILQAHQSAGNLATLAVSQRSSGRYFLFDDDLRLRGWQDIARGATRWVGEALAGCRQLAFSGIQVLDPGIFALMSESGKFSIIDVYLRLAKNHKIHGWDHTGHAWFDVGKPEQIDPASAFLAAHPEYFRQ